MKKEIIQNLRDILEAEEKVLALWLGGSEATERVDQYSDIDLVIISEVPNIPFELLESKLTFPISRRYIETGGPYLQRFYVLAETPETFYLDVVCLTQTLPEFYQEYFNGKRHGTPKILVDKKGILSEASKNPKYENPNYDSHNEKGRLEIIYRTFLKESLRGNYTDAFNFYYRLILILTKILRTQHSPQRHDFGLRYTYSDLPPEEATFIETMLKVTTHEEMQINAKLLYHKISHEIGVS